MKTILASIVALCLAVRVAGQGAQHCDPGYDCQYFYQTSSDLWYFSFSPLCHPNEYVHADPNPVLNSSFHFNICGNAQAECDPEGWNNPFRVGVAVQTWGAVPACPPQSCTKDGQPVCCTQTCELLGTGFPIFSLIDANNPKSGGINITHQAVPPSDLDPNECPYDPVSGGFKSRSVIYSFQCDPNGQQGQMTVVSAQEGPQCVYTLTIRSVHGCGVVYTGVDSAASVETGNSGAIAGAFFGGVFAVLAVGGGIYWYLFYYRKRGYSAFGGGGGGAGAGSAPSSAGGGVGSSSATAYTAIGQ